VLFLFRKNYSKLGQRLSWHITLHWMSHYGPLSSLTYSGHSPNQCGHTGTSMPIGRLLMPSSIVNCCPFIKQPHNTMPHSRMILPLFSLASIIYLLKGLSPINSPLLLILSRAGYYPLKLPSMPQPFISPSSVICHRAPAIAPSTLRPRVRVLVPP